MRKILNIVLTVALVACNSTKVAPPVAYVPGPMATVLQQTAAVAEAKVTAITPWFDEVLGPRHRVHLADVKVHLGSFDSNALQLDMYGGRLPDGRFAGITEQPRFVNAGRYVLFLVNTPWFYSPAATGILRVEVVDGREVLVSDQGFPVTGVDDTGIRFGPVRLFDPRYDIADPFNVPRALPHTASMDIGSVLDRTAFIAAVRTISEQLGVATTGQFMASPSAVHPWNRIPTSPGRR